MHIETFLTQYMSRPIRGTLNWINSHAFGFLVLRIEYISVPWLILLQFSGSYDLSWDTVSTKPFLSIQSRHGVSLPTFFCWECQLEPDLLTYWILYERQFADSNFECILLDLLWGDWGHYRVNCQGPQTILEIHWKFIDRSKPNTNVFLWVWLSFGGQLEGWVGMMDGVDGKSLRHDCMDFCMKL